MLLTFHCPIFEDFSRVIVSVQLRVRGRNDLLKTVTAISIDTLAGDVAVRNQEDVNKGDCRELSFDLLADN